MIPAGGAAALRRLRRNAVALFAIGVGFFVIFNAMLVLKFRFGPKTVSARATAAGSVWDERDSDKQQTMLKAGADPNESGLDAMTPLISRPRIHRRRASRRFPHDGRADGEHDGTADGRAAR